MLFRYQSFEKTVRVCESTNSVGEVSIKPLKYGINDNEFMNMRFRIVSYIGLYYLGACCRNLFEESWNMELNICESDT